MSTEAEGRTIYIPALWVYRRAIVKRKDDGSEFVITRMFCGESRETTTVTLTTQAKWNLLLHNQEAGETISIEALERDFVPTGKRGRGY